jgi:hypothetical protein
MAQGIRHSSYDRPNGLLAGPVVKIDDPCKAAHVFVITNPKPSISTSGGDKFPATSPSWVVAAIRYLVEQSDASEDVVAL